MPKTRQGALYVLLIVAAITLIQGLPINDSFKIGLTGIWTVFVVADILHVMMQMKMDEREQKIEAIAERNASWTIVASTLLTILYVTTVGRGLHGSELTPALIFPVIAGVVVKGLSNFILDRKGL